MQVGYSYMKIFISGSADRHNFQGRMQKCLKTSFPPEGYQMVIAMVAAEVYLPVLTSLNIFQLILWAELLIFVHTE